MRRLVGPRDDLHPKNPIDVATALRAPVLGLYGGADTGIPVETIEKMRQALEATQQPSEIIVYPDAPHGFLADYRDSYRKEAATDGGGTRRVVQGARRRVADSVTTSGRSFAMRAEICGLLEAWRWGEAGDGKLDLAVANADSDNVSILINGCSAPTQPTNTPTRTATPLPTNTPVPPTSTPTPMAEACVGDCNQDGSVTVDELLTLVSIVLGNSDISSCRAGDANGDSQITIAEILSAVNNALNGCATAPPTAIHRPQRTECARASQSFGLLDLSPVQLTEGGATQTTRQWHPRPT